MKFLEDSINNLSTKKTSDSKQKRLIAIITLGFSTIITLILSLTIKKNKKKYYLSIRSPNLLQVTNICILVSLVILGLNMFLDLSPTDKISDYLNGFFIVFHFLIFFSIGLKYLRLYICSSFSKNLDENDLQAYKYFQPKSFYFEYMYMRVILIAGALGTALVVIGSLASGKDKLFFPSVVEIFIDNIHAFGDSEEEEEKDYINKDVPFWVAIFFVENTFIFISGLLVYKTDFKAKIKVEVFFHYIVMAIFLIPASINIYDLLYLFTSVSLFFLQILHIIFPLYLSKFDLELNLYGMTENLTNDLYLFLSNERCYDSFLGYLYSKNEDLEEKMFHLNLYTEIIRYRINFLINPSERDIMKNLVDIFNKFFDDDNYRHYFIPEQFMKVQAKGKSLIKKGESKIDLFDEALESSCKFLKTEFEAYKGTHFYEALLNEIRYQCFIRSKFLYCGLIQK